MHALSPAMMKPVGWTGRWCWSRPSDPRPWNRYVYFRKTFELSARSRAATLRITADSRYTLYVNGQRLHYGPARSYPHHQSFDTLDLAPLLQTGTNVLAVIVHSHGVPTSQSVHRGAAGLWIDGHIELDDDTRIPLDTPAGWLCRDAKAWRQDVARLSIQQAFQEHFDADADPVDWMLPEFNATPDEGWSPPVDLGPAGTMPWYSLVPRGVPLLAASVEPFAAVTGQFRGENARGYKVAEDVYQLAAREIRRKDKNLLQDPEHFLRDDESVTTIPPPEDGAFTLVVLDPGTYRTGHFILDIAAAAGDEVIDILYFETLDKNGMPVLSPGNASQEATADRYRCRRGAQRFETFGLRGMRHVALIFRNLREPLQLRLVAVRWVHADVPLIGRFECSDDMLTRIWSIARNTQLNCLLDAFVDCPWLGQAQWWGDARVQARVTAYAFGDTSLLGRGLEQVAQSQQPDGSLLAHPPTDHRDRLPDVMLTWIDALRDYHQQTNDVDGVRRLLPTLHRLLDFFAAYEKHEGLIGGFDGFRVFLDRADLDQSDFSAVLNLLYLQALRHASALCRLTNDPAAVLYQGKSDALAGTIERLFFDPAEQVFRDGFDPGRNQFTERISQHANALAILAGLKPELHPVLAREALLKPARSKRGRIVTASPFFYAYVLEALCAAGLGAEAIELIREKWSPMVEAGATTFWELFTGAGGRCHAWSASPLYHLSQRVLGAIPTAPGWDQVRIAPVVAELDFARGVVPTPHGPIHVEWEQVGEDQLAVRIDLPDGIIAEFIDPTGNRRPLAAGSNEFNT